MRIKIRNVTKDDSRDLWIWRNHPITRKRSFNTRKIVYETHEKWFDRKINKEGVKIYIVENECKEKVGQIRFEINDDRKVYVNVNLNPRFFKKGIGNKIIKTGTEYFLREQQNSMEVIAEVIKGNIASIKAFKKAGYLPFEEKINKGRTISVLTYRKNIIDGIEN